MQLIKVNEVLIEEEILNEADYGSVFDKEFKSYIVRVGNRKNPSENVRQTGNDGRPVADTICKTFNDAIDIAKNVSSGQGLFKNKNDSSIAFIKFSTKELSDDVQQTAFDSTKSVCLWYRDGKLTSDSKKDLKDLYNDIKQRQKAGVKLQEPEIAHADVQYEKDKAEAEKAEKEAAEKEQKAKEDYAEAIEKLKRFEARLANFCPRTWAPVTKEKDENPHFLIRSPEEDKAVRVDFKIEGADIHYLRLSYVYKNKGQIREKGVISTADWNKEHTESKIIENVAAWKLTEEIPAIDTKRGTKLVTAKSQENPQATVKPEKKEVEIINAHNSKLDVEKGDYAIGADGKLRLISVDQADYSTKEDGKAFRGLKLSKTVVDALKKVGVMESLQLNEEEARTTFFADADVEKIDASISEIDERIKEILSNYEGLADSLDDKKKAEATTTLESIAGKVDEIEGKITSAIEQAKELSAAELNGQVDKVGAASKKFIDGCVGENGILTSIEKSLNVEEAKSWDDIAQKVTSVEKELDNKYAQIDKLVDETVKQFENKTLRSIVKNDEKTDEKSNTLAAAKNVLGNAQTLPKNIQEILNNDSFTTEVEKYGADPATNPFLQFLLNLKNNYKQIWNKINYGQYGVIHNAVIGEQVTLRELQTGKDVKLGDRSMLLFEAFYSVSTTDEHKYLDLRKKLWEKINITLNPVSPGAKIHAVQIPEVGAKLTAQLAHDILVNGDTLRSLKDANDIINQLFGDYERLKKTLATDAVSIQRDIAKELGCSVEDLPDHKDEIILAMKVLLNRAYLNIPLKLDSIYKLAKSLGIDQKEVFTGIEKDENAKWRNYFESDNIDSSNIVQKIVTAVAPIINKEAKNADNAK